MAQPSSSYQLPGSPVVFPISSRRSACRAAPSPLSSSPATSPHAVSCSPRRSPLDRPCPLGFSLVPVSSLVLALARGVTLSRAHPFSPTHHRPLTFALGQPCLCPRPLPVMCAFRPLAPSLSHSRLCSAVHLSSRALPRAHQPALPPVHIPRPCHSCPGAALSRPRPRRHAPLVRPCLAAHRYIPRPNPSAPLLTVLATLSALAPAYLLALARLCSSPMLTRPRRLSHAYSRSLAGLFARRNIVVPGLRMPSHSLAQPLLGTTSSLVLTLSRSIRSSQAHSVLPRPLARVLGPPCLCPGPLPVTHAFTPSPLIVPCLPHSGSARPCARLLPLSHAPCSPTCLHAPVRALSSPRPSLAPPAPGADTPALFTCPPIRLAEALHAPG
ncbi:hypothetical protein FS749_007080 [Ceratobasidium sp. UAMH 11750]|nr:hypothetical protein FS749_007080 [Ceratobasidium sp. UAMH 11750]